KTLPARGRATPSDPNGDPAKEPTRIADLLRKPFDIRSLALTGLFILALLYTIYFTRAILLPLVLALLLSYLLRPVIRSLAKAKVAPPISAAIVLLTLVTVIAYGIFALAPPVSGWL